MKIRVNGQIVSVPKMDTETLNVLFPQGFEILVSTTMPKLTSIEKAIKLGIDVDIWNKEFVPKIEEAIRVTNEVQELLKKHGVQVNAGFYIQNPEQTKVKKS